MLGIIEVIYGTLSDNLKFEFLIGDSNYGWLIHIGIHIKYYLNMKLTYI